MIDVNRAQSVEITISPTGTLWVNVNGECALRSQGHEKLIVTDFRLAEALSARRFQWHFEGDESHAPSKDEVALSLFVGIEQWNLLSSEIDEVARLGIDDTYAREGESKGEVITRVL